MSVDFPEPEGPMMAVKRAAGEPDGDAVEGVDGCLALAVAAGEVGGGDDVGHDERR